MTERVETSLSTDDDYIIFQAGLKRLSGVDLAYYKRRQMERRTRTFALRQGVEGDLTEYLALLKRDPEQLELFLDRMTINVSQLWRNPEHFRTLENKILPELAKSVRHGQPLQVWSAGCSYGAEAYTLGAIFLEYRDLFSRPPKIIGSDIDPRMIERAREGWFSADDARTASPHMLTKYFEKTDGGWRANEQLRRLVNFKVENLFEAEVSELDLILCRNVAIYFTGDARTELHQIFSDALNPGGFLMIGATEVVASPRDVGLDRAFPFSYRRVDR